MDNATVNEWLAAFTGMLVIVAALQLWFLVRSFFISNRPNVRIRYVKALTEVAHNDEMTTTPFEFEIAIVNKGSATAKILKSEIAVCFDRPENPVLNKLEVVETDTMCDTLKAGQERSYSIKLDPAKYGTSMMLVFMGVPHNTAFYVVGGLQYRDRVRRPYKTAFCRRLERTRNSGVIKTVFVVVDDPDHEYAD